MITTEKQVIKAQKEWATGIVKIGSLKENYSECEAFTKKFLNKLYSFELGIVLFKPTRCSKKQFRPTKDQAISYFIAGITERVKKTKDLQLIPGRKLGL